MSKRLKLGRKFFLEIKLFTNYSEFRKIRTFINSTRDISETKTGNDLKIRK